MSINIPCFSKCIMKLHIPTDEGMPLTNALAKWRGDEYILSFLFANQLRFRKTNNAKQQNKQ
jgi:hypothetical protein